MSSSPVKQLWYKWKMLRLPWRKRFLVGFDLSGNTFWEFKDALKSNRYRRIVQYTRQIHYSEVKISPQWHQWLRHVRPEPPSIQEQHADIARQMAMKKLAAAADARWEAKGSYLNAPETQGQITQEGVMQTGPATASRGADGNVAGEMGSKTQTTTSTTTKAKEDPWSQAAKRGTPGENWQPDAWTPGQKR